MERNSIPEPHVSTGSRLVRGRLAVVFLALFWGAFAALPAQNSLLKRADQAYQDLSFQEAIRLYEKALNKKFDKTAMIRLADCYRLTNQYELAAEQYAKVVDIKQLPPVNYFYYAQSLMNNGMFREAEKWFLKYHEVAPDDPRGLRFAESCRDVDGFYQDSAQYRVRPYRFNSPEDDFAPAWYREGIIFASSSGEGEVVKSKYEWNDQPFLDLYYAQVDSAGRSSDRPRLLNGKLNSRFHEAACSVDETNGILYFTRNNYFKGKRTADNDGVVNLKLFYARIEEGGLKDLRALPFNSDQYSVGHPAIAPGGNTLYFVSDMPGGYGGTDLYVVQREGDRWSTPKNLGPVVNTAGNEMFPFVHMDGSLFFASDGLGGLGGLDLFKVNFPLDKSNPPRNLGSPFSSPSDDFGYISSQDKLWGFFSSNRPGGAGGDDLYQFTVRRPGFSGLVLDAKTLRPIPSALAVANFTAAGEADRTNSDERGKFDLLLSPDSYFRIEVSAEGYAAKEQVFTTVGMRPGEMVQDTIFLDPPSLKVAFRVLDAQTGAPLPKVKVKAIGRHFETATDSAGEFDLYVAPYPEIELLVPECMPQEEPQYCYAFTDEGGLELDTLPVIYEWNLGDGTRKRGLEVEHCYNAPGDYHVELNLVDTLSGFLFMNQSGYDLEIRPPRQVYISGPDTVVRGHIIRYDASESYLPGCDIRAWNWEVEGKMAGSGPILEHVFNKTGNFEIKLQVGGSSQSGPRSCNKCVTRRITVLEAGTLLNPADSLRVEWAAAPDATPPVDISCEPQEPESYCFHFSDEGGLASDSLPYVYEWDMGDGTRRRGETVDHCYAHPGKYWVRLQVLDPYTDVPRLTQAEYEVDVRDIRQVYVDSYDSARTRQPLTFNALNSDPPENCLVSAVFWDFGDGQTAIGPEAIHAYDRAGSFRVRMVLSGKTKEGGNCEVCTYKEVEVSDDYRGYPLADAAMEKTLIPPDFKTPDDIIFLEFSRPGYKTKVVPYLPNDRDGILSDSIRLEKQLDELVLEGVVTDLAHEAPLAEVDLSLRDAGGKELKRFSTKTGEFSIAVTKGSSYELMASKHGYLSDRQAVGPVSEDPNQNQQLTLKLEKIEIGKTIALKDIYYDFDKANLRKESENALLKLAKFLKDNPDLQVELGSHTDSRGADGYNLWLSQKRAESAVEFLKQQGLGHDRILARGYGEQRPVNGCINGVPCKESAHQLNRRTEITILGFSDSRFKEALVVLAGDAGGDPSGTGTFAIELGVFGEPLPPERLPEGAVQLDQKGSTYLYQLTGFPDYPSALERLEVLKSNGFPNASIRVPEESDPEEDAAARSSGMPPLASADFYYTIQVAVVARSIPEGFFAPLGEYQTQLQVMPVKNLNKYSVCRLGSYNLARKHLARIRARGYQDAFIVPYQDGAPIKIDAALERERNGR